MSTNAEEVALEFEADAAEVDRFLLAEAQIGIEAEAFFQSAVGRCFKARCEDAVRKFTAACLKEAPAVDLAPLRQEAYGAQMAMRIMVEAFMNGRNAEKQLHARDEDDEGLQH